MAKISRLSAGNPKSTNTAVGRHIRNIHSAIWQQMGDRGEAAGVLTNAFLDWAALEIVSDYNPEASAREVCRELLSRVAALRCGDGESNPDAKGYMRRTPQPAPMPEPTPPAPRRPHMLERAILIAGCVVIFLTVPLVLA